MDKAKYSKASKARWAKVAPQERTERMRLLAAKRWSGTTFEERSTYAKKKLVAARNKKKKAK